MSNVTWMNSKVIVGGNEVNTVNISGFSVTMYYHPTVNGQTYTANNGFYPAQGFFTVNYPESGVFKIGLIPAVNYTTVDPSLYRIYIWNSTGLNTGTWELYDHINGQELAITHDTVYFQVRSALSAPDGSVHRVQINIWFKADGENSEWISAYSEIRANYALIIPAS